MKSQCIHTTVDLGKKSFTEGDILTCIDGYSTDLNFESDQSELLKIIDSTYFK